MALDGKKRSSEVRDSDFFRGRITVASLPNSEMPDSAFLAAPGIPAIQTVPPQLDPLHNEPTKNGKDGEKSCGNLNKMQAKRKRGLRDPGKIHL